MSTYINVLPSLERETYLRLYQCMLKIRLTEERLTEIYPSDEIQSPIHLCIGQEAVSAGVCLALEPTDHLYGTYRSHGIYIAKGGDLKKFFAELYGKETGCSRGKGGSMHLAAPEVGLMACSAIVASTIPVATGDALASQMQKNNRVVVAFFGDGAVDEGVFFESVNFAVLKKLPIIYVCENNHYAIHSKVSDRHKQTELYRFGESLGLSGFRFDGNNVRTVYASMLDAVRQVRAGGEPLMLEYMTYRLYEHVGPGRDHHEAYRDPMKLRQALHNDPLEIIGNEMRAVLNIDELTLEQYAKSIRREIDEAVEFAKASPFPGPDQLVEDVYAT
ncbi:MAG: thiamine pyrophosphate-dependent dehydrogenase E1 component subunit alpha [Candidatus Omnitrophica bacterium]|nr:thiamine pyrophosphate-dependent dehydrogenase E1 component subunit alpha [Candidatus Omnitrophota bacterium]